MAYEVRPYNQSKDRTGFSAGTGPGSTITQWYIELFQANTDAYIPGASVTVTAPDGATFSIVVSSTATTGGEFSCIFDLVQPSPTGLSGSGASNLSLYPRNTFDRSLRGTASNGVGVFTSGDRLTIANLPLDGTWTVNSGSFTNLRIRIVAPGYYYEDALLAATTIWNAHINKTWFGGSPTDNYVFYSSRIDNTVTSNATLPETRTTSTGAFFPTDQDTITIDGDYTTSISVIAPNGDVFTCVIDAPAQGVNATGVFRLDGTRISGPSTMNAVSSIDFRTPISGTWQIVIYTGVDTPYLRIDLRSIGVFYELRNLSFLKPQYLYHIWNAHHGSWSQDAGQLVPTETNMLTGPRAVNIQFSRFYAGIGITDTTALLESAAALQSYYQENTRLPSQAPTRLTGIPTQKTGTARPVPDPGLRQYRPATEGRTIGKDSALYNAYVSISINSVLGAGTTISFIAPDGASITLVNNWDGGTTDTASPSFPDQKFYLSGEFVPERNPRRWTSFSNIDLATPLDGTWQIVIIPTLFSSDRGLSPPSTNAPVTIHLPNIGTYRLDVNYIKPQYVYHLWNAHAGSYDQDGTLLVPDEGTDLISSDPRVSYQNVRFYDTFGLIDPDDTTVPDTQQDAADQQDNAEETADETQDNANDTVADTRQDANDTVAQAQAKRIFPYADSRLRIPSTIDRNNWYIEVGISLFSSGASIDILMPNMGIFHIECVSAATTSFRFYLNDRRAFEQNNALLDNSVVPFVYMPQRVDGTPVALGNTAFPLGTYYPLINGVSDFKNPLVGEPVDGTFAFAFRSYGFTSITVKVKAGNLFFENVFTDVGTLGNDNYLEVWNTHEQPTYQDIEGNDAALLLRSRFYSDSLDNNDAAQFINDQISVITSFTVPTGRLLQIPTQKEGAARPVPDTPASVRPSTEGKVYDPANFNEYYIEFSIGSFVANGTTIIAIAPDGSQITAIRTNKNSVSDISSLPFPDQRFRLDGLFIPQRNPQRWDITSSITPKTPLDGTWQIIVLIVGLYISGTGQETSNNSMPLAINLPGIGRYEQTINYAKPYYVYNIWNAHTGSYAADSTLLLPDRTAPVLSPPQSNIQNVKFYDTFGLIDPDDRTVLNALRLSGAGTSAGVGEANGVLRATSRVSASAVGRGVATAEIVGSLRTTGSSQGRGVATAVITALSQASAVATAVSTATATLRALGVVAGSSTAIAVATGTALGVGRVAGTANGVGVATAQLAIAVFTAGTSTARAVASAAGLSTANTTGTVNGVSSAIATLTAPAPISATSSGVSEATAVIRADSRTSGLSNGVSTAVGSTGRVGLIYGLSSASGVLQAVGSVVGTSAGTSASLGDIIAPAPTAGTSAATSTAQATSNALANYVGAAAGVANATAMLFAPAPTAGTSTGSAAATGAVRADAVISGTAIGRAFAEGNTGNLGRSFGLSTATATAIAITRIVGTVTSSAVATAVGSSIVSGEGTASSVSQSVGSLEAAARTAGSSAGISTAFGSNASIGLSFGLSNATGAVRAIATTQGISTAKADANGAMGELVSLVGTAAGRSTPLGRIVNLIEFEGTAQGVANALAASNAITDITGSALAAASATARAIPATLIRGNAAGKTTATGALLSAAITEGRILSLAQVSGAITAYRYAMGRIQAKSFADGIAANRGAYRPIVILDEGELSELPIGAAFAGLPDTQQVFIGEPAQPPRQPSLIFVPTTLGDRTVYEVRVSDGNL